MCNTSCEKSLHGVVHCRADLNGTHDHIGYKHSTCGFPMKPNNAHHTTRNPAEAKTTSQNQKEQKRNKKFIIN